MIRGEPVYINGDGERAATSLSADIIQETCSPRRLTTRARAVRYTTSRLGIARRSGIRSPTLRDGLVGRFRTWKEQNRSFGLPTGDVRHSIAIDKAASFSGIVRPIPSSTGFTIDGVVRQSPRARRLLVRRCALAMPLGTGRRCPMVFALPPH